MKRSIFIDISEDCIISPIEQMSEVLDDEIYFAIRDRLKDLITDDEEELEYIHNDVKCSTVEEDENTSTFKYTLSTLHLFYLKYEIKDSKFEDQIEMVYEILFENNIFT